LIKTGNAEEIGYKPVPVPLIHHTHTHTHTHTTRTVLGVKPE